MICETEIKFTVPDPATFTAIAACADIAGYAVDDRGIARHTDIYLDTEERRRMAEPRRSDPAYDAGCPRCARSLTCRRNPLCLPMGRARRQLDGWTHGPL